MIRRFCLGWGLIALLLTACPVIADDEDPPAREEGSVMRQRERERERGTEGLDPSRYLQLLEKFQRDLVSAIEPEDELKEELGAVFDDYLGEVRDQVAESRDRRRERADNVRELMRKMKEAQADGDTDRARELREEVTSLRQRDGAAHYVHTELFAELRETIGESDQEKLDALVTEFESHLSQSPQRRPNRINLMERVVTTLQLSDEQRDVVREILDDAKREAAQLGEEERDELASSVQHAIIDELDEEQADAFSKRLDEMIERESRLSGRDGGGRGMRPARERTPTDSPAPDGDSADAPSDSDEAADAPADEAEN